MAHLWNVTNLDAQPCRFESEGYAQFLQYLLLERLDHQENAVVEAAQRFLDRVRNTFIEKKEYQSIPIKDYGVRGMTEYSYTLGMAVFAIFYDLIGPDQFNQIIGSFYSTNYKKGATMDAFIDHCKKSATRDLERFFDDWIYTTKGIELVVDGKRYQELLQYYKVN
jgi:aminopeptidase N